MDDLLPINHPSHSLRSKPTQSKSKQTASANTSDLDDSPPSDYKYDPKKIKKCGLYKPSRASKYIHDNYKEDCLPIPKYVFILI